MLLAVAVFVIERHLFCNYGCKNSMQFDGSFTATGRSAWRDHEMTSINAVALIGEPRYRTAAKRHCTK